jgi:multidrug efflux pump subunit AcrA (membrane-fusion protein)
VRNIRVPLCIIAMAMVFSACSRNVPLQGDGGQAVAGGGTQQATASTGAAGLNTTPLALPTIPVQDATNTGLLGQAGAPSAAPTDTYGSPLGGPAQQPAPTAEVTAPIAQTTTVQRGTIEDVLVLSGQVAPVQYNLTFTQDGLIKEVYVQAGQSVKKGDLLAELDLGELSGQLRQAQLDLQQSQSALSRQIQAGQVAVAQAQLDVDAARAELAEAKAPATAVEIATARADLRQAEASLATVRNNASQTKNQAKVAMEKAVSDRQRPDRAPAPVQRCYRPAQEAGRQRQRDRGRNKGAGGQDSRGPVGGR